MKMDSKMNILASTIIVQSEIIPYRKKLVRKQIMNTVCDNLSFSRICKEVGKKMHHRLHYIKNIESKIKYLPSYVRYVYSSVEV